MLAKSKQLISTGQPEVAMKRFSVDELQIDTFYSSPVFLDQEFILTTPDTPITQELIARLKRWSIKDVLTDGEIYDNPLFQGDNEEEEEAGVPGDKIDMSQEEKAYSYYTKLIGFIEKMVAVYTDSGEVNIEALTLKIRDIIDTVKSEKDLLLFSIAKPPLTDNYLIIHLANSTILTLAMGDYLKLPPHRLIELGLSAILHEIGMTKIPQELYMSTTPLSAQDKNTIMAHTVLGYRILKGFSVSEAVARGVLEHQERLDGSGYPSRLTGDAISLYSRILAVACSYDAMTSQRPYRDANTGHQAILTLLKKNRKAYDEKALMALVYCLSFYPLGSQVVLSNKMSGTVCKANPNDPKYPVVKVLSDPDGNPLPEPQLVKTSQQSNIVISQIVDPPEKDA